MNDTQEVLSPTSADAAEIRELTLQEMLAVAGGPQVTNDTDPPALPENP